MRPERYAVLISDVITAKVMANLTIGAENATVSGAESGTYAKVHIVDEGAMFRAI